MLKRRSQAADGGGGGGEPGSCSYSQLYADLAAFLRQSEWENGDPRTTGTIMLFTEAGMWKAWLHDRDGQCSLFLSAGTLSELLSSCDQVLAAGNADWRAYKAPPSKKR